MGARAGRRLTEARRGARAPPRLLRDDLRLRPPGRAEGREAVEAAAARARQTRPAAGSRAAQRHRGTPFDPRPARDRPGAQGRRALARLAGKSAAETVAGLMAVLDRKSGGLGK